MHFLRVYAPAEPITIITIVIIAWLGRPPIYQCFSKGFRGQPSWVANVFKEFSETTQGLASKPKAETCNLKDRLGFRIEGLGFRV